MFNPTLIDTAATLGKRLKQCECMLTLAESCTGGLVASLITEVAGSSAWFDAGFVVYSNHAKQKLLGVAHDTLITHGAVSEQTAIEMALGALAHSQGDIAASITGIAGPSGGSPDKPVGMVCFAWAKKGASPRSHTAYFNGNRQQIRLLAAQACMDGLLELLNNIHP